MVSILPRKSRVILFLCLAAVVSVPTFVLAGSARRKDIDTQLWRKRLNPATTQGGDWSDIPGISNSLLCLKSGLTGLVTLDVSRAHEGVELRLTIDDLVVGPDSMFLDTGDSEEDRNTFTVTVAASADRGSHEVDVEVRSASGQPVTIHSATLVISYAREDGCA